MPRAREPLESQTLRARLSSNCHKLKLHGLPTRQFGNAPATYPGGPPSAFPDGKVQNLQVGGGFLELIKECRFAASWSLVKKA